MRMKNILMGSLIYAIPTLCLAQNGQGLNQESCNTAWKNSGYTQNITNDWKNLPLDIRQIFKRLLDGYKAYKDEVKESTLELQLSQLYNDVQINAAKGLLQVLKEHTGRGMTLFSASAVMDSIFGEINRIINSNFLVQQGYTTGSRTFSASTFQELLSTPMQSLGEIYDDVVSICPCPQSNQSTSGVRYVPLATSIGTPSSMPSPAPINNGQGMNQTATINSNFLNFQGKKGPFEWPCVSGPIVKLFNDESPELTVYSITQATDLFSFARNGSNFNRFDASDNQTLSLNGTRVYGSNFISSNGIKWADSTNASSLTLTFTNGNLEFLPQGFLVGNVLAYTATQHVNVDGSNQRIQFPQLISFQGQTFEALTQDQYFVNISLSDGYIAFSGTFGYQIIPKDYSNLTLANGTSYISYAPYDIQLKNLFELDRSRFAPKEVDFTDPIQSLMAVLVYYTGRPMTLLRAATEMYEFFKGFDNMLQSFIPQVPKNTTT